MDFNVADANAKHAEDVEDSSGDPGQNLRVEHEDRSGTGLRSPRSWAASFQFDAAEGFGDWQLWLLSRAQKDLRTNRKKNPKLFEIILLKMKDLSHGHFSEDNQKRLIGSNSDVPVYEAKMTGDTRLIYMVDCIRDFETEFEKQVLRVFGVYTHAQVDKRLWSAVSKFLSGKGPEYRKRCLFRKAPLYPGDHHIPPETFPPLKASDLPTLATSSTQNLDVDRDVRDALHELVVLDKFVALTKNVMESLLADKDAAHVFDMSPMEQEIVKYNDSCIVMGRSGTGKTTAIAFKIFGIERAWLASCDDLAEGLERPRQLFVTQSRMLAEKMSDYYQRLCVPYSAGSQRDSSGEAAHAATGAGPLIYRDEELVFSDTLPHRWSELKDEHFPLFLSFGQLCRLLGADILNNTTSYLEVIEHVANGNEPTAGRTPQRQVTSTFVSYDHFLSSYWPHLPQHMTKNLDPVFVFSEFIGVIKGSEATLDNVDGFLNKGQYVRHNHRGGAFATKRETVFALFEAYTKRKRARREWDAADRTRSLLRALQRNDVPGKKLDFIYADEMQDNLLIDALLIRKLAKSEHGLFWAGDTAQTISAGSSFRFEELKAFLHGSSPATPPPRCFQLSLNYRSHSGILRCASSIVKLIASFWPNAIDKLDEERGLVDGSKPIFFTGKVKSEDYLLGMSAEKMEFGAKQCVLVRNEKTRDDLLTLVGDIGLVLTLQESKGLEFDDVLLYKFFEDSLVTAAQWRLLLNSLPDNQRAGTKCPAFDAVRHGGLCHELKCIYVALTRARKCIWVVDASPQAQPLRTLWKAQDLVEDCSALDVLPRFAKTSDPAEWADTAKRLFEQGQYSQAMRCFDRAGEDTESAVAHAYNLRRQAQAGSYSLSGGELVSGFVPAAEAFRRCADATEDVTEFQIYCRIAAECFINGQDIKQAADSWLLAGDYDQCALCYRDNGDIDCAVEVVAAHRDAIDARIADTVLNAAKITYMKENRMREYLSLFDSADDALRFAEHRCARHTWMVLLEAADRYAEAACLRMQDEQYVLAIQLVKQIPAGEAATRTAETALLQALWHMSSFGIRITPKKPWTLFSEMISLADEMQRDLSPWGKDQVTMFRIIAGQLTADQAKDLAETLWVQHGDRISMIQCLHLHIGALFRQGRFRYVPVQTFTQVHSVIGTIANMVTQTVIVAAHVLADRRHPDAQRMFDIHYDTDGSVWTCRGSFLYQFASDHAQDYPAVINAPPQLRIESTGFKRLVRDAVLSHAAALLVAERIFHCGSYGVCACCQLRSDCVPGRQSDPWSTPALLGGPSEDFPRSDLGPPYLAIIYPQILMYEALAKINGALLPCEQRKWLFCLYQSIYPNRGQPRWVVLSTSPEFYRGTRTVAVWIRGLVQSISCRPAAGDLNSYLTNIAKLMSLAFRLDPDTAQRCIETCPCLTISRAALLEARDLPYNIRYALQTIPEMLCVLEGTSPNSTPSGLAVLDLIGQHKIPFDVNVLCHIIETLAVEFVLSYRLTIRKTLHDTVLPQSWIAQIGPASNRHVASIELLPAFVEFVCVLVDGLWLPLNQYLSLDGVYNFPSYLRTQFTLRICRSLILVAQNIPNKQLRSRIIELVATLRSHKNSSISALPFEFTRVNHWTELVATLWLHQAPSDSNFADELIVFKDFQTSSRTYEMHPEACVVIVDESSEDIGDLIYDLNFQDLLVKLSLDSDPVWDRRPAKDEEMVIPRRRFISMPIAPDEDDCGFEYDLELAMQSFRMRELPFYMPAIPTDREHAAATTIAIAWRSEMAYRAEPPGPKKAREKWSMRCRRQARTAALKWRYRELFLKHLPRALVCLEEIINTARDTTERQRDRFATARLAEYDALLEESDRAISFQREAEGLWSRLQPFSEFHREQDANALRDLFAQMVALAHRLPTSVRRPWKKDLEFVESEIGL